MLHGRFDFDNTLANSAMSDQLIAALVAGLVSMLVSGIAFASGWLALRAKSREVERQIRSSFMDKLYQLRLEQYPAAFEITKSLTRVPKIEKSFCRERMLELRAQLGEWINGPAGLIVSAQVMRCSYELRDVLGINYGDGDKYSRVQMEKFVAAAATLRRELREDVRFLHIADHSRIRDVG
jgi:hypothetical protein